MSGAQAKIFMSCGRLLAWPFGVEMWEIGRWLREDAKSTDSYFLTFFFIIFFFNFTRYYLYLILTGGLSENLRGQSD